MIGLSFRIHKNTQSNTERYFKSPFLIYVCTYDSNILYMYIESGDEHDNRTEKNVIKEKKLLVMS